MIELEKPIPIDEKKNISLDKAVQGLIEPGDWIIHFSQKDNVYTKYHYPTANGGVHIVYVALLGFLEHLNDEGFKEFDKFLERGMPKFQDSKELGKVQ